MSRYLKPAVYIAGPISYMPDNNTTAFNKAAREWEAQGWYVVNPRNTTEPKWDWIDYMGFLIPLLLKCHAIANLPGWEKSPGAILENNIAEYMGMHVLDATLPTKPPPQHEFWQRYVFGEAEGCCLLPDYAHFNSWAERLKTP